MIFRKSLKISEMLVYAYADTEAKRKAIEKAISNGEPTESIKENYTVNDEEMIKNFMD